MNTVVFIDDLCSEMILIRDDDSLKRMFPSCYPNPEISTHVLQLKHSIPFSRGEFLCFV